MSGAKVIGGVLWPRMVNQESLDAVQNLDIRDDDVMVATFPKAGTHWVQEIASLIHVNGEVESIDREETCNPLEFDWRGTIDKDPKPPCYQRILNWKSPRVLVTHVLEEFLPRQLKEGKGKVICVFRNPKDIAVSYWHFLNQRGSNSLEWKDWNNFITAYINGKGLYGPWYDHVKQYWHKHKDSKNFLFLYYEDLKKDHREAVIKISNFLGRSLSKEAIDKIVEHSSFKGMSQTHHTTKDFAQDNSSLNSNGITSEKKAGAVGLMRKGMVGDWKNYFTVRQNELFDSVFEKELSDSGVKVEYT